MKPAIKEAFKSPLVRRLAATFVLSAAGVAGIIHDEGKVNRVYLDPVRIPTVCVGHTATVTLADVGKVYSDAVCADLLQKDTRVAQAAVQRLVKTPITQEQYDALTSFTFNVGSGNLASSTLLKYLNAGQCRAAAAEFHKWIKAKGKVLNGLITRRERESALFATGCE